MGRFIVVLGGVLLAACVSERVVLLPAADGRPGAVVVRSDGAEQVLAAPYAGAVRRAGSYSPYPSSAAQVEELFAAALAAQPPRAAHFVVYFVEGGDTLTPESLAEFDRIKAALQSRPAAEILVTGHTDRVGSIEANDALSLRRAESVRQALVAAGLPERAISVAGRGEREPAVATADEVAEGRNRRVEISVR